MNFPQVLIRQLGKKPRRSVRNTMPLNSPPLLIWSICRMQFCEYQRLGCLETSRAFFNSSGSSSVMRVFCFMICKVYKYTFPSDWVSWSLMLTRSNSRRSQALGAHVAVPPRLRFAVRPSRTNVHEQFFTYSFIRSRRMPWYAPAMSFHVRSCQ